MPRKCQAPRCVGNQDSNYRLCHSPPDIERYRHWADFVSFDKEKIRKFVLCIRHFEEKYLVMYEGKAGRLLRGSKAIPTIPCEGPDKLQDVPVAACSTSSPSISSASPPSKHVENSSEDNVLQGDEDTCHMEQYPPELDISEPFTPPLEDDQDEPQRNRNHYHLIEELPELYMSITLPYLEKEPLYLKWVYDVIKGEAERERVVYESPCKDDKNGFLMIRDAEWDGEDLERLHLVALPYRPGLLTIRDLRDTHLILLKNIYNIGKEVIEERYGVPGTQLNIYLQYLPSFYHLHIHFTMLRNETCGFEVQKNHLLAYVINNLELWPDYYQKATLMLPLQESHNLFFRFKNMVDILWEKPLSGQSSYVIARFQKTSCTKD